MYCPPAEVTTEMEKLFGMLKVGGHSFSALSDTLLHTELPHHYPTNS
jgi:hypothetical protein